MKKICNKCNEEKEISDFYKDKTKKDGYMKSCKSCKKDYGSINKDEILNKKKIYYSNNIEHIKEYRDRYQEDNRSSAIEYSKKYYQENRNRQLKYQKKYYQENKESVALYRKTPLYKKNNKLRFKERYKNDPVFKISMIVRYRISRAIRDGGYTKRSKTFEILGCSFIEFKVHIENQFVEGMSWDNHGDWQIGRAHV